LPDVAAGLLIHADSERNADMFVATGVLVVDPFTYLESDGRRIIVTNVLEADMMRRDSAASEIWLDDDLGRQDLIRSGTQPHVAAMETVRRALERAGISEVAVPPAFPVALADYLRERSVVVRPDKDVFEARRRRKTPAQLEGIRHAQRATEAAFAAARELIGSAEPGQGGVLVAGVEPLTCERVRAGIVDVLRAGGCEGEPPIVGAGPAGAGVHDLGTGPIRPSESIIIDVFPRHTETRFCADMTRTFCWGEAQERLRTMHTVVLEALKRSMEAIRPGVSGKVPWNVACDVIEAGGFRTQRTVAEGERLDEDFFHGLGHGVGFDVHEPPYMGLGGSPSLEPGDVVTNEPGVYRKDFGGVRLEDLVLVTDDGREVLTSFDYELEIC
jgi:Xaa-Pro aminopeptidase